MYGSHALALAHPRRVLPAACLFAFVLVYSGFATAEAEQPDAQAILAQAAEFYAGLATMSAEMETRLEFPAGRAPMGKVPAFRYQFALARPGRIAFRPGAGMPSETFVQNSDQQFVELPVFSRYVLKEPETFAALLADYADGGVPIPGGAQVLSLAVSADQPGSLMATEQATLLGKEKIDGNLCHHLAVNGPDMNAEIWITTGPQPWVVRHREVEGDEMSAADAPEPDESGMVFMRPLFDVRFRNWQADPALDDAFTITPREKFEKLDRMPTREEMGEMFAELQQRPDGPHDSVDKPAPAAQIQPLEGETLELADLKGKVVVLDFWATWCKPCRQALPVVSKVTAELAPRGVVFYAVNQMESADKIRSFLAEQKLELPVARDADGTVSRAFRVSGIPHSVIIDREGVVRHVHVGFGPGLDKKLRGELEELLAE